LDLEELLTALKDGKWHRLQELTSQFGVRLDRLMKFAEFLSAQGIVEFHSEESAIKIQNDWQHLFPLQNNSLTKNENIQK